MNLKALSVRRHLSSYRKNEDGVTAIEFSMLAVPFMLAFIAIIELSMFMVIGSLVQGAVMDASRLIKTGQLQQGESLADQMETFEQAVCDHGGGFLNCDNVQFQVRRLRTFDENLTPTVDEEGSLDPPQTFEIDQIGPGCISMVRVLYRYQFITPFFGNIFANYPDNRRLHMATTVFRTEPYDFTTIDADCRV